MSSGNIHGGHRERLRVRFLDTGFDGFQEHEILELILFYALPRVNTNEIAHQLIARFGSLNKVLDADVSELIMVKGISSSGALLIKYMRDLCRAYALSSHCTVKLSNEDDINDYLANYFRSSAAQTSVILNLSLRLELLSVHSFSSDELLPTSITSRELAETALKNSFRRIIIGRNSPETAPVPTENDYAAIRLISETLTPIGVEIFDYIICCGERTFSMRKNGAFSFRAEVDCDK